MFKAALLALLVSALATVAPAPATEIPFEFSNGFIRVDARVSGAPKSLSMLLDSGASVSVLHRDAARELRLKPGKPLGIRGVMADSHAYQIEPLAASVGGIDCGEIALVADLSNADSLCSKKIDGLIGADFFRDRVVQIDYARRRVRVLPGSIAKKRGQVRLPVRLINEVACVELRVDGGRRRWTRLDTGCNDALHWVRPGRGWREKPEAASIGFVDDSRQTSICQLVVGNRSVGRVPTVIHENEFFEGEAGLLGNGVLSRFTVTLDWPSRVLILQ